MNTRARFAVAGLIVVGGFVVFQALRRDDAPETETGLGDLSQTLKAFDLPPDALGASQAETVFAPISSPASTTTASEPGPVPAGMIRLANGQLIDAGVGL